MALFTSKADAALPLLTRVYQVSPELAGSNAAEIKASETGRFIQWCLDTYKDSRAFSDGDVVHLARLFACVRSMMDAAADKRAPSPETEQEIQAYIDKCLSAPTLGFMHGSTDQGDSPLLYYRGPFTDGTRQAQVWEGLGNRVLRDLVSVWGRCEMRRCEECKSVFVMDPRRKQEYCSQRCRARVGGRNRYAKLFEDSPKRRKPKPGKR